MTLIEIIILLIFLVLSIVVIRITFKFDINEYLKERRKIKINQLKNICPHAKIDEIKEEGIVIDSLFISPPGTINFICSQCKLVVNSEEEVYSLQKKYENNPKKIFSDQERLFKKAKKLKLI